MREPAHGAKQLIFRSELLESLRTSVNVRGSRQFGIHGTKLTRLQGKPLIGGLEGVVLISSQPLGLTIPCNYFGDNFGGECKDGGTLFYF